MNSMRISERGFTIVELLIVIVVIAILAAISVVAYNGIQDRAIDARRASAIKAIAGAVTSYYAQHDRLPDDYLEEISQREGGLGPGSGFICLGEKEHYPATSDFSEGQCFVNKSGDHTNIQDSISDDFNNDIRPMTGSVPNGSYPVVKIGEDYLYRGIMIEVGNLNNSDMRVMFAFDPRKTVSCPQGQTFAGDIGGGVQMGQCMIEFKNLTPK